MQIFHMVFSDGSSRDLQCDEHQKTLRISRDMIPEGVQYADLMPELFAANAADEGYYLIPGYEGSHYSVQTFFKDREDNEEIFPENAMSFYACSRKDETVLAVIDGMKYDFSIVIGVKNNRYYLYPRFVFDGEVPYEDIVVHFLKMPGLVRYPEVAKVYRQFQLDHNYCRPLKEKAAERPVLKEYAETVECRIRMAWKPVPSELDDQIIGVNEPPVHTELTFEDVDDIIAQYHDIGIDKVNFCLIGWNAGGHDGRFPDLFPVEPSCGTIDDLKDVVKHARSLGYLITAHTNLIEFYSVATRFNRDYALIKKDGTEHRGGNWGGGKSYLLCPEMAHRHYVEQDLRDLKDIGFYGAHYFDVFSIYKPYSCSHPDHPLNTREIAQMRCKIMKEAQDAIGCVASEGSWDFAAGVIDYVLYMAFFFKVKKEHPMCDKYIPFWALTYHGITLYNCFAASVNANIKNDRSIKVCSYAMGGRPLNYVNSRFTNTPSPWGNEDLRYFPKDKFKQDLETIKQDYDFYKSIKHLQYEFIDDYIEFDSGAIKTVYSDGSVMLSNPTEDVLEVDGVKLEPFSNVMAK